MKRRLNQSSTATTNRSVGSRKGTWCKSAAVSSLKEQGNTAPHVLCTHGNIAIQASEYREVGLGCLVCEPIYNAAAANLSMQTIRTHIPHFSEFIKLLAELVRSSFKTGYRTYSFIRHHSCSTYPPHFEMQNFRNIFQRCLKPKCRQPPRAYPCKALTRWLCHISAIHCTRSLSFALAFFVANVQPRPTSFSLSCSRVHAPLARSVALRVHHVTHCALAEAMGTHKWSNTAGMSLQAADRKFQ